MRRKIRLTESDLHRIVKESVRMILRENVIPYEEQIRLGFEYRQKMGQDQNTAQQIFNNAFNLRKNSPYKTSLDKAFYAGYNAINEQELERAIKYYCGNQMK